MEFQRIELGLVESRQALTIRLADLRHILHDVHGQIGELGIHAMEGPLSGTRCQFLFGAGGRLPRVAESRCPFRIGQHGGSELVLLGLLLGHDSGVQQPAFDSLLGLDAVLEEEDERSRLAGLLRPLRRISFE